MARCSCTGSQCNCLILVGAGLSITGSGQASDPYVISLAGATVTDAESEVAS